MKNIFFLIFCFIYQTKGFSQIIWASKPLINADKVFPFEEEMALFIFNGKYGFVDRFGNVIVPSIYKTARSFHDGLAIVSNQNGYGAIDKKGVLILDCLYPELSDFETFTFPDVNTRKFIYTKTGNRISIIDYGINYYRIGQQAFLYSDDPERITDRIAQRIQGQTGLVFPFYRGYSKSYLDRNLQIIDTNFQVLFDELFDSSFPVTENILSGKRRHNWGYYKIGKGAITPGEYTVAYPFKDGFGVAKLGDYWTFVDSSGNEVRSQWYEEAHPFFGGMAAIKLDDRYGYVNHRIEHSIPYNFEEITEYTPLTFYDKVDSTFMLETNYLYEFQKFNEYAFHNGLAKVKNHGKYGFIDQYGEVVVPMIYDEVYLYSEGLAAVKFRNKWGFVDEFGTVIIEPTFEEVNYFRQGLCAVKYGAFWGVIKNPIAKDVAYTDYHLLKPKATAKFDKIIQKNINLKGDLTNVDTLYAPAGLLSLKVEFGIVSNFYLKESNINYEFKLKLTAGQTLIFEDEKENNYYYKAKHNFSLRPGINTLKVDIVNNSIIVGSSNELIVVVPEVEKKKKK